MPTETELIEAIRDAPDRLDTWLIYADLLLERGERAGELITTSHRGSARELALKTKKYLSQQPDTAALREALKRGAVEATMHLGHWSVISTPAKPAAATDDGRDEGAEALAEMLQQPLGRFIRELQGWFALAASAQRIGVAVEQHGRALRTLTLGASEPWNGGGVLTAPRLRHATLRNVREVGEVAHPLLESLELETAPGHAISEALTSLRCPKLRALTLGGAWRDPWPGVTELPSLTSLTLEPTSTAILNAAALPNALGLTELRFTSRLDSPAADTLQRASSMFSPRLKVWDARLDP